MKFYDAGVSMIIIIFVITCICVGVSYEYLGQSSVVTQDLESAAEKEGESIILKETGIDVTPKTTATNTSQVTNATN